MKRKIFVGLIIIALLTVSVSVAAAAPGKGKIGVNVVLNTTVTDTILADLGTHGKVRDVVYEINAVTMQASASELPAIQALPYVAAANPDASRLGAPIDKVSAEDFVDGWNTWDQCNGF